MRTKYKIPTEVPRPSYLSLNDHKLVLAWLFHICGKRASRDLTGGASVASGPSFCASGCRSSCLVCRSCPSDLLRGKIPNNRRRGRTLSHEHGVESDVPELRHKCIPIKHHWDGDKENESSDNGGLGVQWLVELGLNKSVIEGHTTTLLPPPSLALRAR